MTGEEIQIENGGFTRIHNAILETLAKANLAPLEFRIVIMVLRKTYGFNKKADIISITQFEECGGSRVGTIGAIKNLMRLGILFREAHGQSFKYGFNKYFEKWLPEAFETRYAGRGNNFHKATSKPVDNNKDAASKPHDTRTSKPVDRATSKPVDIKLVNPMVPTKEIKKEITKEKLKKVVPQKLDYFPIANAIAKVSKTSLEANKARIFKEAKLLSKDKTVTSEKICADYGPGGLWYQEDWRGKKGQHPTFEQVRSTWGTLDHNHGIDEDEALRLRHKADAEKWGIT